MPTDTNGAEHLDLNLENLTPDVESGSIVSIGGELPFNI